MAVNNHIDKGFRSRLKTFRQSPPADAWTRLEAGLNAARRKKRIAYLKTAGIAASFLLIIGAGAYWLTNKHDIKNTPKEAENTFLEKSHSTKITKSNPLTADNYKPQSQEASQEEKNQKTVHKKTSIAEAVTPELPSSENSKVIIKNPEEKILKQEAEAARGKTNISFPISLPQKGLIIPIALADISVSLPDMYPKDYQIASGSNFQEQERAFTYDGKEAKGQNNWELKGKLAPVYAYRSIQIHDELPANLVSDKDYYNSNEEAIYAYAGGIDISFRASDRLSLQTGFTYSKAGHINQDAIVYDDLDNKYELIMSTSAGAVSISTEGLPAEVRAETIREDSTLNLSLFTADIKQGFSYLEVPLVLKWNILNSKLRIDLAGGLSPALMINNEAYFNVDGKRYDLERDADYYSLTYNSLVGVDLKYSIGKNLSLSLEPVFKYGLRPINRNHSIEYHPYSLSCFTGVSYHF